MASKALFMFCAQALLIQSVFSQCNRAAIDAGLGYPGRAGLGLAPLAGPSVAYNGLAAPGFAGRSLPGDGIYTPAIEFTATSGGPLPVTSTSAIAPIGISVVSDNVFEGALSVAGELPFVGTTDMEGAMPSAGAGAINHSCGNGVTAMASDGALAFGPGGTIPPIAASFVPVASISPAAASFAPAPLAGRIGLSGCGRDIMY